MEPDWDCPTCRESLLARGETYYPPSYRQQAWMHVFQTRHTIYGIAEAPQKNVELFWNGHGVSESEYR